MATATGHESSTVSSADESQLCSRKCERRNMTSVIRLYPLINYSVRSNDYEDPPRISDYKRSLKLRQEYESNGMVRTVQGVLLGHQNSIIHVLLLKNGVGQLETSKLPEVTLYNNEDEIAGMKRLMTEVMGFQDDVDEICQIQHVVAKWWRPNFEAPIYPYIPSHITKPKELIRVFVVELPKQAVFTIAKNNTLVAAPLFEIYGNVNNYGPIIASLPHVLGRFNYLYYP